MAVKVLDNRCHEIYFKVFRKYWIFPVFGKRDHKSVLGRGFFCGCNGIVGQVIIKTVFNGLANVRNL